MRQSAKAKVTALGSEHMLETFSPAARSAAARSAKFKLLCALGCLAHLRVRQFDVEAAHTSKAPSKVTMA
eukprot:5517563-Pleurochrysis_carterae.AAC.1